MAELMGGTAARLLGVTDRVAAAMGRPPQGSGAGRAGSVSGSEAKL